MDEYFNNRLNKPLISFEDYLMDLQFDLKVTDIAAWWGAVVASLVFIWDIYKWKKSGPRIAVHLAPNMLAIGEASREGKKLVLVSITNVGDRPTTLKNIGMEFYTKWQKRFLHKFERCLFYPNLNYAHTLPRLLNPGEEWTGVIPQERLDLKIDLKEMADIGYVYICVAPSHQKKIIRKRLKF